MKFDDLAVGTKLISTEIVEPSFPDGCVKVAEIYTVAYREGDHSVGGFYINCKAGTHFLFRSLADDTVMYFTEPTEAQLQALTN